ncbi:MAG: hypothetical protein VKJ44_07845 [Synechococcus sp.]|nr:hypothetical protein [Synechococcus sp.]
MPVTQCANPTDLPGPGEPGRWPFLQRLRRQRDLEAQPWLQAIETGMIPLANDLVAVLASHLDGDEASRLLHCWLAQPQPDPALPALIGERRDRVWGAALRQALAQASPAQQIPLLPLLGHQRERADFGLLQQRLRQAAPLPLRRAALEGLQRGLAAWPRAQLRAVLSEVATDLQPALAAEAIDALARLPRARGDLLRLARRGLDSRLQQRLQRRLHSHPARPLLLLVHGRSGGEIGAVWQQLATDLALRRGAPVQLLALTAEPAALPRFAAGQPPATLVPLLLLPGLHVRQDLPALWQRRQAPLSRVPFLGAWPAWQQLLAEELLSLGRQGAAPPLLLHHPLSGPLARRFLSQLERRCAARCRDNGGEDPPAADQPFLPLVLAPNRLTEALQAAGLAAAARPLLARPRLREGLIRLLEELP